MLNNYDRIASRYDKLSRLIFGKSIVRAQQALLPLIMPPARVLIVGGGTGWIIEEMGRIHPSGLAIDYVEISSNMLELARKRDFRHNKVTFIHAGIEDYAAPSAYDIIMTPFLFDNFSHERAGIVFRKLDKMLKNGAFWLFTDFHISAGIHRFWQKALLRSMYVFFRNISHVEANRLPDMQALFDSHHFQVVSETFHFGGFIRSAAYRKSGNGSAPAAEDEALVENDDR